ncbi:hypothetical protein H2198_001276 [Neophaeococcomyces mojaviensis]|uniref:Uncharacterized protein n=1 Tax=Neophaeococcomyces mojaviensis TaxID=3383035 RepID=A0ACC3AHX0_9EURO|nr:hypothetical protein H2198_001276 [Knufia sp. JES_112]
MNREAEEVDTKPVAGINNIDLTDPAVSTEPREVEEVEEVEEAGEEVGEEVEEVEEEIEEEVEEEVEEEAEEEVEEEVEADEEVEVEEADTQRSRSLTVSVLESAPGQIDIAPMEEFFDVTFNRDRMIYTVASLKSNLPS